MSHSYRWPDGEGQWDDRRLQWVIQLIQEEHNWSDQNFIENLGRFNWLEGQDLNVVLDRDEETWRRWFGCDLRQTQIYGDCRQNLRVRIEYRKKSKLRKLWKK